MKQFQKFFFIGDHARVQLLNRDGIVIQRIGRAGSGDFYLVYGIYVMEDRLYVSDNGSHRLQIFRPN